MTSVLDSVDDLQSLIDGRGNSFANRPSFYGSAEQTESLSPVIQLADFIGLANIVYSDPLPTKTSPAILLNGTSYTVVNSIDDPGNSYQGLILFDKGTNSLLVVNRGSQETEDFVVDAQMAVTTMNSQWSDALTLANEAAAYAASHNNSTVYAVGHSLGGSLAELQAADFGWVGYTFNAYGASDVFKTLGLTLNQNASIHNYRTLFDVVSDASTHLGSQPVVLETANDLNLLTLGNSASPLDIINTIKGDHSIKNFFAPASDTSALNTETKGHVYVQANAFSAPASGQTVALAENFVSGLALSLRLGISVLASGVTGVPIDIPVGDLTVAKAAEGAWQYINDQSVSGIEAIVPSDTLLLANALNSSSSNNIDRASLAMLSPVVLQGVDLSHLSDFGLWAPGLATGFTKDYLIARNDMVQAMIAMAGQGQLAGGSVSSSGTSTYVYSDLRSSPSPMYTLDGKGSQTYDVVFAGDNGNAMTATPGSYEELFGGAGNDTLFGGSVGSTLQGGAGNDDYIIDGGGTGVDYILDTDGQGIIEWKSADGSTQTLSGGDEQAGTSTWKSADGSITYAEDLSADGSTELEIQSGNKIAYVDDFTNGEFGITLNVSTPASPGSSNLSQLRSGGLVGDTNVPGEASYVYTNDVIGAPVDRIYGTDSSGSSYGNEISGEGSASYIYAGNGSNTVLLGDYYYHATDPLVTPKNTMIQGGSGDQGLIGVGNGSETITGGAVGSDTTATTSIDGGGAAALLAGGGQNSVIFGGTGADTLIASSATAASPAGFNPTTVEIAGLSFWGDAYSSHLGANGTSYELSALPAIFTLPSSPDAIQLNISLYQSDNTFGTPTGLLGSSLDSGAEDGASSLPGSVLMGGTGTDWLIGNRGDDTIIGGQPSAPVSGVVDEVLVGGAGADVIYGGGGAENIYGDMSPGAVSGWADLDPTHADTIYGGTGNEFIYGSGGKDVIYGGSGDKIIHAGNGAAYVDTGSGHSSVYGGSGNDTIVVDGITDYVQTGNGNSYVEVAGGNSTIAAGAGHDTIEAAGGSALITEGSGLTTLIAGTSTGSDTVQSGSGGAVIQLTDGVTESVLVARDVNGDLVLSDPGFDTQITVSGYFGTNTGVSLQFADGTTWGTSEIQQASITPRTDGGNDTLVGSDGSDNITAGYGDTSIVGVSGNNTLTGGAGDDTIQGGSGADTIEGGSGSAQVMGGTGSETYVFNVGDGSDTIFENATAAGDDTLKFGAGITASDLTYTYDASSNNLLIQLGASSASTITVGGLVATQASTHQIAEFAFADGTILTQLQVIQQALAINGATGSDSLTGTAGPNYFDGKGGNDIEVGAGGNDTFVFNAGYGHLEINESYTNGQAPVLQLGAGITAASLHVTSTYAGGYNLTLSDGIGGDQITLDDMLPFSTKGVAIVQLADGTTLTRDQLIQMEVGDGTSGSDSLYGTSGAELFDGNGGNDVEIGNGGNDTFVFNAGYGQLFVGESYTNGQQPVLRFGTGITTSSLHATTDGNSLILTDGISGDQITLDNMWSASNDGVAIAQLADGTSLTASQLIQLEMTGTTGSDTIFGTSGADLIDGKGGNDLVIGGGGSDTFVFNAGYGHLEIGENYANGGQPALQLGAGIATSAFQVTTDGGNLILTDGVSGDEIVLDSAFLYPSSSGVAKVQLADGTIYSEAQLVQMEMAGTTGNDTIYGTSGADLIDGKGGSDYVIGRGGSDTFVFNPGYGDLTINESYTSGQQPVLQLGTGITASGLHVSTDGDNMVLTAGISGDQITLDEMWLSSGEGVALVQLADGTTLTRNQLIQTKLSEATTGSDTIYGTPGNDLIDGKGGGDSVNGGGGSDTFVYNESYGELVINESYSSGQQPVLELGPGITISTLLVSSDSYNGHDDLVLTDGVSGDQIYLLGEDSTPNTGVAEVQLADGTTYTAPQLIQMTHDLHGTTSNDTLYGTSGADLIDGKGGHDSVVGDGGSDTFVFAPGYGDLTINEAYLRGQQPLLQLGTGITASALQVTTDGTNVVLTDGVSSDQITLDGMWSSSNDGVAVVQFANGTSLTAAQLIQIEMVGTTGSSTIYGTSGDDLVDGKGGNDSVIGGGGSDTFVFNAGYGHLNIDETYVSGEQPVLQLGAGITASSLQVVFDGAGLDLTDGISGDQITLENQQSGGGIAIVKFADGTTLSVEQLNQMAHNAITGTTGNDTLAGTTDADLIDGKGGDDDVTGWGGNDTFVFNAGYGDLDIREYKFFNPSEQQSVLQLGPGITASMLDVTGGNSGNDLILKDGIPGDEITLEAMLERVTDYGVAEVEFADGTSLTAAQLVQMEMTGMTGNDTIYGTPGADLIDGKGGDDFVSGSGGSDTFIFNVGYGHLNINETYVSGEQPVLQLGAGITTSALRATSDGVSLMLTDGISGDQITVGGMLSNPDAGVAVVQLADGTTLTRDQLIQMEMTGTTGNDTFYGTSGANLLDGKGGNDSIVGGGGNDTFVFNSGYGYLAVNESYTSDQLPVLQLGAGIAASTIHVTESGNNLVLTDGISGDQVTLLNMATSSTSGVASVALADGTTLSAAQLTQMLHDITGTTGDDTLTGTSGADLIDGKGGNDSVVGDGGNDTFVFNSDYGHLAINESFTSSQQTVLQLGPGITASALHVTEASNNLLLTDGISGDQITLNTMWSSATHGVKTVKLADGTTLTRSQLIQMEMTGTTGNDTINGTSSADLIDGKGGNDSVVGGGGNDSFVFNSGYGHLAINETYPSAQAPILQLGAGITASVLHVTETSNNMLLTDGITGDQITLNTMWSSATHGVATVKLADGTVLTRSQLIQMEMTGTSGNDTLYGTSGADLIDGKGGSDSVVGSGGNDTFVFNPGYGHLVVNESFTSSQHPVLQLGAGITASTLKVKKSGSSLLLTDGVSGDQITLQSMATSSTHGVATVHLGDGTTLTRSQLIGMETASVKKASSAAVAISGTTPLPQLNPLIHAIASYTGDSLGGGITSTIAPPVISDLMLHAAA